MSTIVKGIQTEPSALHAWRGRLECFPELAAPLKTDLSQEVVWNSCAGAVWNKIMQESDGVTLYGYLECQRIEVGSTLEDMINRTNERYGKKDWH